MSEATIIKDNDITRIFVIDKPGEGGACHEYTIGESKSLSGITFAISERFGRIKFQKGPIKEVGINGCTIEDLLAIVIHRLQGFQSGLFACRENALALTKIQEALHWLNHRTADRLSRGVEGTNKL